MQKLAHPTPQFCFSLAAIFLHRPGHCHSFPLFVSLAVVSCSQGTVVPLCEPALWPYWDTLSVLPARNWNCELNLSCLDGWVLKGNHKAVWETDWCKGSSSTYCISLFSVPKLVPHDGTLAGDYIISTSLLWCVFMCQSMTPWSAFARSLSCLYFKHADIFIFLSSGGHCARLAPQKPHI